jgi:proteasome lid subunit RPN8/RPN11
MDLSPSGDPPPESPATSQPDVPSDRDVANVDPARYEWRDLPRLRDERHAGFQAIITRSALNDMHRHGRSSPDVEVCGVIVGNVYRDERGPYLYVEASIKGDHAAGKTAQVTFTSETWTHINDEMERNFVGRKILGWYHTHPGFGIFLSDMDLFIQNNFFPEPWQAAYVYDPQSGEDGIFLWRQGKATRDTFLVDPDTINTDPPTMRQTSDVPTTGTLAELTARVQSLEHRIKWLVGALFLVAVLALLSPLLARLYLPDDDAPPPARATGATAAESVADADAEADAQLQAEIDASIPASLQLPRATNAVTQPESRRAAAATTPSEIPPATQGATQPATAPAPESETQPTSEPAVPVPAADSPTQPEVPPGR